MSMNEVATLPLTLGKQLAAARERLGLDQDEMAESVSASRSTISRWERDKAVPPFNTVVRWSELTGWDLSLFARAETPTQSPDDPSGQGVRTTACNGDAQILDFTLRPLLARVA